METTQFFSKNSVRSPECSGCRCSGCRCSGCRCSGCRCCGCHYTMKTDTPKLNILLQSQGMNAHCGCAS